VAYAFLLTKIGVEAVRSASYGTKVLGIRKDILGSLPIPVLPNEMAKRIGDFVRSAVAQRECYSRKLQEARELIYTLPEVRKAASMSKAGRVRQLVWTDLLTHCVPGTTHLRAKHSAIFKRLGRGDLLMW